MLYRLFVSGLFVLVASGCSLSMDGKTVVKHDDAKKSVYSLDGDIVVDERSDAGKLNTVDGNIILGAMAAATEVKSVDGNIKLGNYSHCKGNLASVEGAILLEPGSRVGGYVYSYAGSLQARDATIMGGVRSFASRITLSGGTVVNGGISLMSADQMGAVHDRAHLNELPSVVIGPGVYVTGPISSRRGGKLRVSKEAHIGTVEGLSVQWF